MINNYKEPNVKGPRFRNKRLGFLNTKTFNEFRKEFPAYKNIDNSKLKKIIKLYNKNLWEGVIEHRDGVELPNSLGYLFIGTCPPPKNVNTNYALSKQYGKVLSNKNWETDGNIAKIVYTNWAAKYKFKHRELWRFEAYRDFKRTVAKTYPDNWTKYIYMPKKHKIANMYYDKTAEQEALKTYNEFEI